MAARGRSGSVSTGRSAVTGRETDSLPVSWKRCR